MGYPKSLIIQKEINSPNGKFLRVWAKNYLRFEIFEKILKFTYKQLDGKLIFTDFISDLPGPLSFYTSLENSTFFYYISSVLGEGESSLPFLLRAS